METSIENHHLCVATASVSAQLATGGGPGAEAIALVSEVHVAVSMHNLHPADMATVLIN